MIQEKLDADELTILQRFNRMTKTKDIANQRFGRLIAKEIVEFKRSGALWKCLCDCGNEKLVYGHSLRSGRTTSCGCYHKEQLNKKLSIGIGEAAFNSLFRQYKHSAKNRHIEFNLTKEEFRNITKLNCYYCGNIPNQIKSNPHYCGDYIYNGVDRIDNNLGYIKNNCVPCCGECNISKGIKTKDQFLNMVSRIYRYQYGNI